MFALVQPDGKVAQIESKPFPMHPDFQWIKCDDTVKNGFTWDGKKFNPFVVIEVKPVEKLARDKILDTVVDVILGKATSGDLSKLVEEAKR